MRTPKTPGEKLKAWRLKAKLSQAEAAKLAGVQQGTWCGWESDSSEPRLRHALRLEVITSGVVTLKDLAKRAA
jgi:transcriptional regulator with XRE-family HTH domain